MGRHLGLIFLFFCEKRKELHADALSCREDQGDSLIGSWASPYGTSYLH